MFWECERSTPKKTTQAWGQHANSTGTPEPRIEPMSSVMWDWHANQSTDFRVLMPNLICCLFYLYFICTWRNIISGISERQTWLQTLWQYRKWLCENLLQLPYLSLLSQDVNDNVPFFTSSIYESSVTEGAQIGTSVLQVSAHDKDLGRNGEVCTCLLDYLLMFCGQNKSKNN